MRTQPVIAWVTVIGTALSIFLIMTVVMMQQVNIISFKPESHRDRMLYGLFLHVQSIEENQREMSSGLSYEIAQKLYGKLDGIEEISFQQQTPAAVDATGTTGETFIAQWRQTDDGFWRVFDHTLLKGRYYDADEVAASRKVAVVSETTAKRLFGGESPIGQHFELDHNDFEVIGVVADISRLASWACGDVFSPVYLKPQWEDLFGDVAAVMLVDKDSDFDNIRKQVVGRYAQFNTELAQSGLKAVHHGAPFDQELVASGLYGSNTTPDNSGERKARYAIYAILLIVPAINLSSMLHSRLRRRVNELGIRRAFGCTRRRIISDIIGENLIVTVIGGAIGLLMGILFAQFYDGLYTSSDGIAVRPALSLLLNWRIIGIAFGACFILNIISAAVPAWQASRMHPVEAINAK